MIHTSVIKMEEGPEDFLKKRVLWNNIFVHCEDVSLSRHFLTDLIKS